MRSFTFLMWDPWGQHQELIWWFVPRPTTRRRAERRASAVTKSGAGIGFANGAEQLFFFKHRPTESGIQNQENISPTRRMRLVTRCWIVFSSELRLSSENKDSPVLPRRRWKNENNTVSLLPVTPPLPPLTRQASFFFLLFQAVGLTGFWSYELNGRQETLPSFLPLSHGFPGSLSVRLHPPSGRRGLTHLSGAWRVAQPADVLQFRLVQLHHLLCCRGAVWLVDPLLWKAKVRHVFHPTERCTIRIRGEPRQKSNSPSPSSFLQKSGREDKKRICSHSGLLICQCDHMTCFTFEKNLQSKYLIKTLQKIIRIK